MSDRLHNELGNIKSMQGGTMHARPHLAVGPVSEAVENAAQAVAPAGSIHKISADNLPEDEKMLLEIIGYVRKDEAILVRNAEHRKAVDEILSRLFQTREKVLRPSEQADGVNTSFDAIEHDLVTLEEKFPGIKQSQGLSGPTDQLRNAAERVAVNDRARVISKIESALKRVEKLRSEITISDDSAYTRLLNMGSAVSGLNVARNRISETGASLSSAANTADNVMVNLRAVVLATHGKISPEIVRLVLT